MAHIARLRAVKLLVCSINAVRYTAVCFAINKTPGIWQISHVQVATLHQFPSSNKNMSCNHRCSF